MGLTGIQIFKLLPKTNCGECGVPTCLAFAMNLASGKAELDACPYVSAEAKEKLSEASAPPIRPVSIGAGGRAFKTGGETVMFRHEKTFYNPTALGVLVTSDTGEAELEKKLAGWNAFQYERVGLNLRPELVALKDVNGDAGAFAGMAKKIALESEFGLVLMSDNPDVLKAGAAASAVKRPLLYAATSANVDAMGALAKEMGLPLAVKADSIDGLMALTTKLTGMGLKDLVLDPGSREPKKVFENNVAVRRAALKAGNRALGFPVITFACEMAANLDMETVLGAMLIAKYAGIVIFSDFRGENLFPLLLERLNIFTDPQRPMTVTQGIYEIGAPNENSPVLITTNFSLTYFIVSGEIEGSRIPSWLLIMDTEGLSVMTAWAAGKFSGDAVASFIKKSGIADKVNHKKIIIPGYAASISGDMEEELPGWEIIIGPRDASLIPKFLKETVK
ncbi:MAG: acetyl-CoA decarbonylase/synthase complex subunit gamma [Deltaproteobacteria bacterium CG_4_8_14_3_um_filter_51_11]|nr:acetyl-CoA decarbonylase/synthase complex subunit gamma [bacterium]OIP41184.1 MAG: acetyl-CoA decarbonylase/synthase complex subunit gamma [Desulfobacteraceae bacterium CG2_30_51_40]PIP45964.1 MAG: acetyl-CoA decarbonylase/synthase complex subunit gamma [Deltaproteobacteria bacterium CG23_combo_of_CG06-09_8_20_14_all_51_20]PIX19845.1 MAG: acetyl-CoA decarbonylase/synthase complex subunit gamma [Deltaproteobacteria bacterium CG_4_8_14_3_um_filter_51_11]PJB34163.1 MAG: acetyl-CoA decarbonylase